MSETGAELTDGQARFEYGVSDSKVVGLMTKHEPDGICAHPVLLVSTPSLEVDEVAERLGNFLERL